ncbi:MAG: hypothetical protein ACMUJM_24415 [bacterium]
MNKKTISITLSLIFIVLIIGCSGGGGKSSVEGEKESDIVNTEDSLINIDEDIEPVGMPEPEDTLSYAADAIEKGNIKDALEMFDEGAHEKIQNSLKLFDDSDLKDLAESLSKSTIVQTSEKRIKYQKSIIVQTRIRGKVEERIVHFYMVKLPNGNWVIEDL